MNFEEAKQTIAARLIKLGEENEAAAKNTSTWIDFVRLNGDSQVAKRAADLIMGLLPEAKPRQPQAEK